jgi:tetratricopeptide (TPR) repeat protein
MLKRINANRLWPCLAVCFFAGTVFAQTALRTVTVTTERKAAVWIDGVRYGTAGDDGKLKLKALAGRRVVRVRADGFAEASKPLLPAAKEITVPLTKTTDETELAFQEAERLALADRAKAAEKYRAVIKLNPQHVAAHIGLARTLSEASDYEAALKAVAALRRVSPTNAEASAIEGRVYKDTGDEKKAIAAFKRAIAEGKGFQPEAYAGLGLLYKEKADELSDDADAERAAYTEAVKNLSVAIKQLGGAPDNVVIYQLLGVIYERQKKYKEAIAVYEDFLRAFPDSNETEAVRSFIVQVKKQMAEQ